MNSETKSLLSWGSESPRAARCGGAEQQVIVGMVLFPQSIQGNQGLAVASGDPARFECLLSPPLRGLWCATMNSPTTRPLPD